MNFSRITNEMKTDADAFGTETDKEELLTNILRLLQEIRVLLRVLAFTSVEKNLQKPHHG